MFKICSPENTHYAIDTVDYNRLADFNHPTAFSVEKH